MSTAETTVAGGLRRDLRLARTYDRLTLGLVAAVVGLQASTLCAALPLPWGRYLYLVPLWYLGAVLFRMRPEDFVRADWSREIWLARWSAIVMAGLAPFWGWWQAAVDSRYCLVNVALLCAAGFLFLFHLVGLSRILAEEQGRPGVVRLAAATRLAIIYLLFAPAAAFFATVWYNQSAGHEVMFFLGRLAGWQRQVLFLPALLACVVCWQLCRFRLDSGGEVVA